MKNLEMLNLASEGGLCGEALTFGREGFLNSFKRARNNVAREGWL